MIEMIDKLVKELIQEDKSFEWKEKELKAIIEKMIELKPDVKVDKDFYNSLKSEIYKKIDNNEASIFDKITMFKYSFAIVSSFVFITVIWFVFYPTDVKKENKDIAQIDMNTQITKVDKKSFWNLNNIWTLESTKPWVWWDTMIQSDSMRENSQEIIWLWWWITKDQPSNTSMIHNPAFSYKYVGKKINIPESMMVYKQQEDENFIKDTSNILKHFSISNIDISKFEKLQVTSLTLQEDIENGYKININPKRWEIRLMPWDNWDFEHSRNFSIEDIPDDNTIITKAQNFLKKYWINVDGYENMQINKEWKKHYESSEDKENFYIPRNIQVILPIMIENFKVYNLWWNVEWLNISYDIKKNKVSSFGPLSKLNLIASNYPTNQDVNKIVKNYRKEGNNILKLDNARLVYVKMYKYENNQSNIYYVPAILSNVQENKNIDYHPENIIIPIIEDFKK